MKNLSQKNLPRSQQEKDEQMRKQANFNSRLLFVQFLDSPMTFQKKLVNTVS